MNVKGIIDGRETEICIGTIASAEFGFTNHTTKQLGVNFALDGKGWMSSTGGKFTLKEKPQDDNPNERFLVQLHEENVAILDQVRQLLLDADAVTIEQLVGKEVEVTFIEPLPTERSPFIGKKFHSIRILNPHS